MPVGETPEAHNKGKNVTYPTDAKLLHEKVIRKVLSIVKSLNLPFAPELHFHPQEDFPGPTFPQPSEKPRQGLEGGQAAAHHCGKACQGTETQPEGKP